MEQKSIYQALIDILKEVQCIEKKEKNEQQKFMFRGIDTIMNDLHDLFAKHGVFPMPVGVEKTQTTRPSKMGGTLICTDLIVRYRFYATDGSYVDAEVPGEAMDSGDKSTAKALSIAFKYLLLQTFVIPTAEKKDPDADTHEVAAAKQAPKPAAKPELLPGTKNWMNAVAHLRKPGSTINDILNVYTVTNVNVEKLEEEAL